VRKADNLPPSCAAIVKSGNHNFLEPSGPLQDCNGTALPFTGVNTETNRHVLKLPVIPYIQLKTVQLPSPKHICLPDLVQCCVCLQLHESFTYPD